jgi:hypothetical protein
MINGKTKKLGDLRDELPMMWADILQSFKDQTGPDCYCGSGGPGTTRRNCHLCLALLYLVSGLLKQFKFLIIGGLWIIQYVVHLLCLAHHGIVQRATGWLLEPRLTSYILPLCSFGD